jgi:hypothetical protein
MLPAEVQPSGEIDDLFSTFERYHIPGMSGGVSKPQWIVLHVAV